MKDINDTTGITSDWQDSADYDIGDAVPFKLTATLTDSVTEYGFYTINFHTIMENGLTFGDIGKVTVGGNEISDENYSLTKDDHSFELSLFCGDGVSISDTSLDGAVIEVNYTAVLNENAVSGNTGNLNKAYLEYSSDPADSTKTSRTADDNVLVFTYGAVFNKVDEKGDPIEGAELKLEKKLSDGSLKEIAKTVSDEKTTFEFVGLDDGDYILSETKAPSDEYKIIDPITFTVTADHNPVFDNISDRNGILTSLSGDVTSGEITLTADDDYAELSGDVKNTQKKYVTFKVVNGKWNDNK